MQARQDILERNLKALSRTSAPAAALIEATPPRTDVAFLDTDDAVASATIGLGPASRALASKRRPLAEAERLAATIDLESAGGVVVLGFGLGHHVRAMAERMGRAGVVVAYEPDVALLRAVLERVDCADWLQNANVILLTDPEDAGAMAGAVRGVEGILALGVKVLEHPPSKPRLGPDADRFVATLTQMISAMRATLATTLLQVETTVRNELMNLDHYATVGGVRDLAGIGAGRPAIVVSAGPSLRRNIELLEDPAIRERVVIIAVQTVLKPLLERGIRPHFVTALDYHEISRRFYENLAPEDVAGVTLVAETKANPAILDAFPGAIRCPQDATLDDLLGPALARPMGKLERGATVAHLAYYLARHLGCDPVILTGQDLGFTDGQYYASGAAIHTVWAPELNEFNTLEMMEWQRIARARRTLRRLTDVHGRTIYTDEQMNSYLVQFERDFAADAARGLRVIDATEGGVAKRGTEAATLADALAAWAPHPAGEPPIPDAPALDRDQRLAAVAERVADVRADVNAVARDARRTRRLLEKMLRHQDDAAKVNRLIEEVYEIDARVKGRTPAFALVSHINQTGTLNRFKADRSIKLDESLDPKTRQRKQIERDITNVTWLGDAADTLGDMLDATRAALKGKPKITRDPQTGDAPKAGRRRVRAGAIICVDPDTDALGRPRDLADPLAGENALRLTLRRLAAARQLTDAILVTDQPDRVRALAGDPIEGLRVHVEPAETRPLAGRRDAIRSARAWTSDSWRGGLASMTVYDELLAPTPMLRAMETRKIDAAVLVGADWPLVDPALIDEIVERHTERPDRHRIVFSQAAPGLGPCLVERSLMAEFVEKLGDAGVFASIAGILGYLPVQPQPDPIAKPICVGIDTALRDASLRCIADARMPARIDRALAGELLDLPSPEIVRRLREDADANPDDLPARLTLDASDMPIDLARRILRELEGTHTPITLAGDVLTRDDAPELVELAKAAGPVHVRTRLRTDEETIDAVMGAEPEVVSVDLLADTPETYLALTGTDDHARVVAHIERLLEARHEPDAPDALRAPWIVPRITRRDEVHEEIETFFDRWLMAAGACVIDPLPKPVEGARIAPIEQPRALTDRLARTDLSIRADGSIPLEAGETVTVADRSLADAWRGALDARRERVRAPELAAT